MFRNTFLLLVALQLRETTAETTGETYSYCSTSTDCDMSKLTGITDGSRDDCICAGGRGFLESGSEIGGGPFDPALCADITGELPTGACPECTFGYCYSEFECVNRVYFNIRTSEAECVLSGGQSFICSDFDITGSLYFGFATSDPALTNECNNICSGSLCGDPHLKSWSGTYFDYHGVCDLVFLEAPDLDLTIHARTKARYEYSYIESAAIQVGEDILEVGSYGEYFLNGVRDTDFSEVKLGPYTVDHEMKSKKEHIFVVKFSKRETLTIKTFKDLVSITVDGTTSEHFASSYGLLGTYLEGALVARDGKTNLEHDLNAYGQEWQVRDTEPKLFQANKEPQYPNQCILPDPSAQSRRRLGETIAEEAAAKACDHFAGEAHDVCVYDVMATGDLEVAAAGAY